jgi:hypothetical protein
MDISQQSSRNSSVSSHGGSRQRSGRPRHVRHAGGRPRRTLPGNIINYLLFCHVSLTKLYRPSGFGFIRRANAKSST